MTATRRTAGGYVLALLALALVVAFVATHDRPADAVWGGEQRLAADREVRDLQPAGSVYREVVAVWTRPAGSRREVVAAFAGTGTGFGPPTVLDPDGDARDVAVAGNALGAVNVAWRSGGAGGPLMVAERTAGAPFGSPQALAPDSRGRPLVAVDRAGSLTAVWRSASGAVQFVHQPAGGVVPPAGTLLADPPADLALGDLATTEEGGLLTWSAGGRGFVGELGPDGALQRTTALAPRVDGPPRVALGRSGLALVTWVSQGRVQLTTRPPGTAFGAPVDLGPGSAPRAAVPDALPYGTAAWLTADGVETATFGPQGDLERRRVSPDPASALDLAVDWQGSVHVVSAGPTGIAAVTRRSPEGPWSAPVRLASAPATAVTVAPTAAASALAAWSENGVTIAPRVAQDASAGGALVPKHTLKEQLLAPFGDA